MPVAQDSRYTFRADLYSYRGGSSRKFWCILRRGSDVITWWGRMNTPGQTLVKSFSRQGLAENYYYDKMSEKERKGYNFDKSVDVELPEIYSLIIGDGDERQLVAARDLIDALEGALGYDPRPTY